MADSFRDLLVWQRAIQMTLAIYRMTIGFPKEELYGLTSQIRRAGVSVASNIAEGSGACPPGSTSSSWAWLAAQIPKFKHS